MTNQDNQVSDFIKKQLIAASDNITSIIKQNNLDIKDIAKSADITVNTLRTIMRGNSANIMSYLQVCEAIGRKLSTVFTEAPGFVSSNVANTIVKKKEVNSPLDDQKDIHLEDACITEVFPDTSINTMPKAVNTPQSKNSTERFPKGL